MVRKMFIAFVLLVAGIAAALAFGPTEPVNEKITFDKSAIGSDPEAYLTRAEAEFSDIRPGAQKQIIWADKTSRKKTDLALVYIHGFSATLEEIRPVPDLVAGALGANLFYTRLSGHGRTGAAMAEPTVNDWYNDVAEALAVGRALGERVVVIGTSTGATFASWAATKSSLMEGVAGMILVSPNFAVKNPAAIVLSTGFARKWVPAVFGAERSFKPQSKEHGKWWSHQYPSVALLPMQASVDHVGKLAFEAISVPALFIFHPDDSVVDAQTTRRVADRWGTDVGKTAMVEQVLEAEDKDNHVIAGRVLSPANSQPIANKAINWIKAL